MINQDEVFSYLLEMIAWDEEPGKISEKLLDLFGKILNHQGWTVLILNEEIEQFEFLRVEKLKEIDLEEIRGLIEEEIIDWILETGVPFIIPPQKTFTSLHRNLIVIPLRTRNKKIGVIVAFCSMRENSLKQTTLDLLTLLARQAAISMENYLLRQKMYYQTKEQFISSRIYQVVESEEGLEKILKAILNLSLEETQSQYGFFLKIDEEKKRLSPWVSLRVPLSRIKECSFSLKEGAIGYVASTGRALIIDNYPEDVRFQDCAEFIKIKPRNLISVPLRIKEENLGILTLCDTIEKPFYSRDDLYFLRIVATYTAVVIKNKCLYEELRRSFLDTVKALIQTVEAKDPYTSGHSRTVSRYSLEIGKHLRLSRKEMEMIRFCGILHDIGKIGISDSLLNKPSKLNEEEYRIIKEHPVLGEQIVKQIKFLRSGLSLIRHHHERYNGRGYPDGLKGEKIPLLARILSVADAFDAMTSHRPYRKALSIQEAMEELKRKAGTQFDPKIVEIFCNILKKKFSGKKEFRKMNFPEWSSKKPGFPG